MTALLDHLWQSTLFALPLGALTLLLRRHAAALRFWAVVCRIGQIPGAVFAADGDGRGGDITRGPDAAGWPDAGGAAEHGRAFHQRAGRKRRAGWDHELDHGADRGVGGRHASGAAALGRRWLELRALVSAARPLQIHGDIGTVAGADLVRAYRTRA